MVDDVPIEFFDVSWLAVRAASAEALLAALDLSDPAPVSWRRGVGAVCGDYWDFDAPLQSSLSRVFISPEIGGWRLAIGGWLGGADLERLGAETARFCRRLSKEFDDAHAFTTQGRMDWYSWCLARDGSVFRRFFWADDEPLVDKGRPTPIEARSREEAVGRPGGWSPSESLVMALAAEYSIDPGRLASMQSVGQGFLAVTAWGRKHGVPSRSLDDVG